MSDPRTEQFGLRVGALAATLTYPATPDVAGRVRVRLDSKAGRVWPLAGDVLRQRRLALAALAVVLACLASLAVPQVRATLIEFIQIGVVRIFLVEPSPTATPTPPPTGTPLPPPPPTPIFVASLLDLAGETTLAEARRQAGFDIPLPTYPDDLGDPDRVYLQFMDGSVVVLVWLDPAQPEQVQLSLQIIAPHSFAIKKLEPQVIQFTTVDGGPAVWAEGPYLLQITNREYDARRLIDGHVLIWEQDQVTFRLETDQTLEEAVKIAESLK